MDLKSAYAREKYHVTVRVLVTHSGNLRERMLMGAPELLLVPDDGVPDALREQHRSIKARLTKNRSRPTGALAATVGGARFATLEALAASILDLYDVQSWDPASIFAYFPELVTGRSFECPTRRRPVR